MIRKMEMADIIEVVEIEKQCFSDAWSQKTLEGGLHNPLDQLFVSMDSGHVCGYSNFRVIAGEGEVLRIAVLPQMRGRGHGKKLMETMVAFARKNRVPEATLEVRSGNLSAINLYKSYGFKEEAIRKSYYHDPTEDAIIMWNRNV